MTLEPLEDPDEIITIEIDKRTIACGAACWETG
jgi:hypothetical protein